MKKLSYKRSGVDIDSANTFINKIKPFVKSTNIKGCVGSIGGFSGLFNPGLYGYKNPLLAASTDGVGTKLKVAILLGKHDTVGVDLVAMCVNDLVACGAKPLFFLDYFGTGKLEARAAKAVIKGIAEGCRISGCALIGGETAELPGMYKKDEYDLAGFAVGIVEKKKVIDGSKIKNGNLLLGIESSGFHSNGFSLVRKAFSEKELKGKLGKMALAPTKIYVKPILGALKKFTINGIAHITGGGFYDNIARILPKSTSAVIHEGAWDVHPLFSIIRKKAAIETSEMYRTFNMGIGMVLAAPRSEILKIKKYLFQKHKLRSWIIGEIIRGKKTVEII